jgi:hypothetical protein
MHGTVQYISSQQDVFFSPSIGKFPGFYKMEKALLEICFFGHF